MFSFGNFCGTGKQRTVKVSPQVRVLGPSFHLQNGNHIVKLAECCANAYNIHPSVTSFSPNATTHVPHVMYLECTNI
jgi:hypothetical protein